MPDTQTDPPVIVAHESFTSTGGYRYQATEITRHAGPIARLEVTNKDSEHEPSAPVSLEPSEAAEIGLWLLRNVVSHERDEQVRSLLTITLDALSRDLAAVLDVPEGN